MLRTLSRPICSHLASKHTKLIAPLVKPLPVAKLSTMTEAPASKRQKTSPEYELLYHAGMPGRGEYVRLAFEAVGIPYNDPANEGGDEGKSRVYSLLGAGWDSDGNPPIFAPPALRIPGAGAEGKSLLISQTPNILLYLADHLPGLVPDDLPGAKYWVHELALTALDLCNEAHDTHHPVAIDLYYEDQKEEAKKKATGFRESRIPKYFGYFEKVLEGNKDKGQGKYLVGSKLSYADTTVWQTLDGLFFAFPNELKARKSEFPLLLDTFYPSIKEEKNLKQYLSSKKRLSYSLGIYRHYPELDRQE